MRFDGLFSYAKFIDWIIQCVWNTLVIKNNSINLDFLAPKIKEFYGVFFMHSNVLFSSHLDCLYSCKQQSFCWFYHFYFYFSYARTCFVSESVCVFFSFAQLSIQVFYLNNIFCRHLFKWFINNFHNLI